MDIGLISKEKSLEVEELKTIGDLIGKNSNLPAIFISNFIWIEQYEHLDIDKNLINKFKTAYSYINKFIQYDLWLAKGYINANKVYYGGFIWR